MFTISLDNLTRYNIGSGYPFTIQEISEKSYGYDARKEMGLLYETEQEAYNAALKFYYAQLYQKTAVKHPANGQTVWYNNSENGFVVQESVIIDKTVSATPVFASEKAAQAALSSVGEVNFMKYILGLRNRQVYVKTQI